MVNDNLTVGGLEETVYKDTGKTTVRRYNVSTKITVFRYVILSHHEPLVLYDINITFYIHGGKTKDFKAINLISLLERPGKSREVLIKFLNRRLSYTNINTMEVNKI